MTSLFRFFIWGRRRYSVRSANGDFTLNTRQQSFSFLILVLTPSAPSGTLWSADYPRRTTPSGLGGCRPLRGAPPSTSGGTTDTSAARVCTPGAPLRPRAIHRLNSCSTTGLGLTIHFRGTGAIRLRRTVRYTHPPLRDAGTDVDPRPQRLPVNVSTDRTEHLSVTVYVEE